MRRASSAVRLRGGRRAVGASRMAGAAGSERVPGLSLLLTPPTTTRERDDTAPSPADPADQSESP